MSLGPVSPIDVANMLAGLGGKGEAAVSLKPYRSEPTDRAPFITGMLMPRPKGMPVDHPDVGVIYSPNSVEV